ncbi:MAG TPA: BrnA antitoxin family protein [Allosphingosinicella sp.]|nr:BrnA antitoxin family protein [Allosphingosinicella sp.]
MSEKSTTSTNPDLAGYDPDDAPPLTWEMAERAQHSIGERIIREADPPLGTRRGRPPKPEAEHKQLVSIRLSPEVVQWLRASGPGWQTRVDDLLRREMGIAAE